MFSYRINSLCYLVLIAIGACGVVSGRTYTTDDIMDNDVLHLNLAYMRDRADLIICGYVQPLPPYKEGSKDLYRIVAVDALKGSCPSGSLIVVHRDIYTYQGADPKLEVNMRYLMFLERIELGSKMVPSNSTCFQIIGTWKGVIPYENIASEHRAASLIQKDYSVNVIEQMVALINALRFSLQIQKGNTPLSTAGLSPDAMSIYNVFKLNEDKRSNMRRIIGIYDERNVKSNMSTSDVLHIPASIVQPAIRSSNVVSNCSRNVLTTILQKRTVLLLLVLFGCCVGLLLWKRLDRPVPSRRHDPMI